jgi:hypothetical protein
MEQPVLLVRRPPALVLLPQLLHDLQYQAAPGGKVQHLQRLQGRQGVPLHQTHLWELHQDRTRPAGALLHQQMTRRRCKMMTRTQLQRRP